MDTRASGWWAMIFTVFTEASLFAYLLFSYYYLAVQPHAPGTFPEGGAAAPGHRCGQHRDPAGFVASRWAGRSWASSMAARWRLVAGPGHRARCLGVIFLVIQCLEWARPAFRPVLHALFLALFRHHRLSHGACGGGRADAAGADLLVGPGAISTAAASPISISARSTGISSMRCGSRCSSPSTSRRLLGLTVMTALDPIGPAPETRAAALSLAAVRRLRRAAGLAGTGDAGLWRHGAALLSRRSSRQPGVGRAAVRGADRCSTLWRWRCAAPAGCRVVARCWSTRVRQRAATVSWRCGA